MMKPSREKVTRYQTDTHIEVIKVLDLTNEQPIAPQVTQISKAKSTSDIPTAIQNSTVAKNVKVVKLEQKQSLIKEPVAQGVTKKVQNVVVEESKEEPTVVVLESPLDDIAKSHKTFAAIKDSKLQAEQERLNLKEMLAVVKIESKSNEDLELRYAMKKGCSFQDILTAKEIYIVIDRTLVTRVNANLAGGKMKTVDSRELIQLLDSEPDMENDSKGFKVHENAFMFIERTQVNTKLDEADENNTEKLVKREERLQLLCDGGQGDNVIKSESKSSSKTSPAPVVEKDQGIVIAQGKTETMVKDPVQTDTKSIVIEQKNMSLTVDKKPEMVKVSTTQQAIFNNTTDLDKGDLPSQAALVKPEDNKIAVSEKPTAQEAKVKAGSEKVPVEATADDSFSTCLPLAPEALQEMYHVDFTELVIEKLKKAGFDYNDDDEL